jgi:hypothetical protein
VENTTTMGCNARKANKYFIGADVQLLLMQEHKTQTHISAQLETIPPMFVCFPGVALQCGLIFPQPGSGL